MVSEQGMLRVITNSAVAASMFFLCISCNTVNQYLEDLRHTENTESNDETTVSQKSSESISNTSQRELARLHISDEEREIRKNALIASGVAALNVDNAKQYMDIQEVLLRQKLTGTGVYIIRQEELLILTMPSQISFVSGSASIDKQFYKILYSVTSILHEYDKTLVEIIGHTDSKGSNDYNLVLSKKRAANVAKFFSDNNLEPKRLGIHGFGEKYPIADNETHFGREQNRRVEIALVPIVSTNNSLKH